jgi:hypothetical protein
MLSKFRAPLQRYILANSADRSGSISQHRVIRVPLKAISNLRLSRIHQRRPERKQMGIVVNVETSEVPAGLSCQGARLCLAIWTRDRILQEAQEVSIGAPYHLECLYLAAPSHAPPGYERLSLGLVTDTSGAAVDGLVSITPLCNFFSR